MRAGTPQGIPSSEPSKKIGAPACLGREHFRRRNLSKGGAVTARALHKSRKFCRAWEWIRRKETSASPRSTSKLIRRHARRGPEDKWNYAVEHRAIKLDVADCESPSTDGSPRNTTIARAGQEPGNVSPVGSWAPERRNAHGSDYASKTIRIPRLQSHSAYTTLSFPPRAPRRLRLSRFDLARRGPRRTGVASFGHFQGVTIKSRYLGTVHEKIDAGPAPPNRPRFQSPIIKN